jgi:hypothetical protein
MASSTGDNKAFSAFALRLVNSKIDHDQPIPGEAISTEAEANMQAHILGIFISLDTDRDGLITRQQLLQGVQLLGLRPTKVLLNYFVVPAERRSSAVLLSAEDKIKQSKIDAEAFCRIMLKEWKRVKSTIHSSLDAIMSFARDDGVENDDLGDDTVLSANSLRHLMQGIQVPTKLSEKEFLAFSELVPKEACGGVTVGNLKKALFAGDYKIDTCTVQY